MSGVILPRKRMYHAHGQKVVFVKGPAEKPEHVLMKIFIWALYLPQYPDLTVEVKIGDRYKPDVVQLDGDNKPIFWGEAGKVSVDKIESLVRRFRDTHFVIAKWETRLEPLADIVRAALLKAGGAGRAAPFDLINFRDGDHERFIDEAGQVTIAHDDVEWLRL